MQEKLIILGLSLVAVSTWADETLATYVLNGENQHWDGTSEIKPASKEGGNTLSISNGSVLGSDICGAAGADDASYNTLTIDKVTGLARITGGDSDSGDASHNSIIISDSTIGGSTRIIGGSSQGGNATHNTITLRGDMTITGGVFIDGGRTTQYGGDAVTGNTLNLDNLNRRTIIQITNFEQINVSMDSWKNGGSVLHLGITYDMPDTFTLTFNPDSWDIKAVGERMTLISFFSTSELDTTGWTVVGDAARFFTLESVQNGSTWDVVATAIQPGSGSNQPIPEPASATLALLTLAGLAARRVRPRFN